MSLNHTENTSTRLYV